MNALNVSDLRKQPGSGATSESTNNQLMGTLLIVTNENEFYEQGTILLRDFASQESIVCVVDRFLPKLNNTTACIHIWCYVRDEELGVEHLEFLLDDIYQSPTQDSLLLVDHLEDDKLAIQISLQQCTFYKPGSVIQPVSKDTTVNIAGNVEAISILYVKEGTPAAFFVELSNQEQKVSVFIMFYGNLFIPFYPSLRIGKMYMFQGLKVVTMMNEYSVLSFSELDSRYLPLTIHQYHHELLEVEESPFVSTENKDLLTMIPVKQDSTYTGCITRVIDSSFGIYELDHRLILCVFHYLGYSASNPYRVMTRIRLHHIHIATIEPGDGETTHLFSTVWKAPHVANIDSVRYMALVACMKSHIEIISFPPHSEYNEFCVPITPSGYLPQAAEIKQHVYMECIKNHCTFSQFIRRLEIYATLLVKFMNSPLILDQDRLKTAYDTIVGQVFTSTGTLAGDPVSDFFMHHKSCTAVGHETGVLHVVVDSYPFLSQIKTRLQDQLQEYHMNLAGSNNLFEANDVSAKLAIYDQIENYRVLGVVDALPDGRLYLMDGNSRILLLVTDSQMMDLGGIYLVHHAQMFDENLSYIRQDTAYMDRAKLQTLSSTYLVCLDKDLLEITMNTKMNFQIHTNLLENQTRELQKYQLSSMETLQVLNQKHQYLAAHVINGYPTHVCFTADGKLYLESRVSVRLYNVDGLQDPSEYQNSISTDDCRECMLILSSREKSLSWHHLLQINTRWIIYGLDKEGSILPENQKHRLTFLLNSDKHILYPLLFQHPHSTDAVQLEPVFSGSTLIPPNPVYQVSQLVNPNCIPADITETASHHFFKKVVTVQGVIVTKRFIGGFENVSLVSRCALQLYQDLGISTGKPNRKLYVQLRQPDTLDVLDIYIEVTKVQYPLGLVVGSSVVFHNLIRKQKPSSPKETFCVTEGFTTIQIINTKPSASVIGMLPSIEQVPTRTISSFMDPIKGGVISEDGGSLVYKLYCSIKSILSISFKWECRTCGSVIRNNECFSMCMNASRSFTANAFVEVSDGSGNANASIDGERLIFKILQLSPKQVDALKRVVLKYGPISYGGWGNEKTIYAMDDIKEEKQQRDAMHGYTLEDMCNNAKQMDSFWLYGKTASKSLKRKTLHNEKDLIQKHNLRKVNISDNGSLLKTMETAKLRIKVIEVVFAEARLVAYDLLNKIEAKTIC